MPTLVNDNIKDEIVRQAVLYANMTVYGVSLSVDCRDKSSDERDKSDDPFHIYSQLCSKFTVFISYSVRFSPLFAALNDYSMQNDEFSSCLVRLFFVPLHPNQQITGNGKTISIGMPAGSKSADSRSKKETDGAHGG